MGLREIEKVDGIAPRRNEQKTTALRPFSSDGNARHAAHYFAPFAPLRDHFPFENAGGPCPVLSTLPADRPASLLDGALIREKIGACAGFFKSC
jgi:hypothetical protein